MAQICLVAPRMQTSWVSDWISSLRRDETVRLVPICVCNSKGLINYFEPAGIIVFGHLLFWPYLVPRTIQHALRTRARGTLVVPQWPSAVFWLMLFPDGCTIAWFIQEVRVLDKTNMVICLGKRGSNLFGSTPNTNLLAIRLDFRSQEG